MRFGVQEPPMSAGPPDSSRALSSAFFASYSIGLASPLDTRARRKIIVRTCVDAVWTQIDMETTQREQSAELTLRCGRRLFVEV